VVRIWPVLCVDRPGPSARYATIDACLICSLPSWHLSAAIHGEIASMRSQVEIVQGFTYPFARPQGIFARTIRAYEGTARHPELGSGYVGPGRQMEVSGWKSFRSDRHPYALVLVPGGKFSASRDPRPTILVGARFA
jgi:hypothetical protein